jgi:nucleotide-binding universal stress UspA family protein
MEDSLFRKTLVAFDGSEQSERALDYAAKEATHCVGELIVLTVIPEVHVPTFTTPGAGSIAPYIRDYKEKIKEEYSHMRRKAENELKEKYPNLKVTSLLIEGRPATVICDEAEKMDVSAIVISSRGLHGVERWVLGSTSRRVVDDCKRPILIIK